MTKAQAQRLAKKIFEEFGSQIRDACKGTSIPPSFIAGLIANEAGKDKQGNIKREATRFEPHVYAALKAVRDGKRKSYGSITRSMIADATDASLKALATSHEATQIMGYHVLTLGGTVGELSDPSQHFKFTVKLLQANGFPAYPNEASMDREMRQWNTGSESGKTYHENYVPNARMIRAAYAELEDSAADAPTTNPQTIEQTTDDTTQTASDTPPPTTTDPATTPPVQVTTGSGITHWLFSGGMLASAGASVWAWVTSNASVVAIAVICVTVLILAVIFRKAILDAIRLQVNSDKDRFNVT